MAENNKKKLRLKKNIKQDDFSESQSYTLMLCKQMPL